MPLKYLDLLGICGFILGIMAPADALVRPMLRKVIANAVFLFDTVDYKKLHRVISETILNLFEKKRFLKSAILSCLMFTLLLRLYSIRPHLSNEVGPLWFELLFFGVFLLIVPDYLSVNQTLYFVKVLKRYSGILTVIIFVLIDIAFTFFISFVNVHFTVYNSYLSVVYFLVIINSIGIYWAIRILEKEWNRRFMKWLALFAISMPAWLISAFVILLLGQNMGFENFTLSPIHTWELIIGFLLEGDIPSSTLIGVLFITTFATSIWILLFAIAIAIARVWVAITRNKLRPIWHFYRFRDFLLLFWE